MIQVKRLHSWRVSRERAIEIQMMLRSQIRLEKLPGPVRYVAGVDAASSKGEETLWGGVVVLNYPELEVLEEKCIKAETPFPYVPGLLSFREIPVLLQVMEMLETDPDVILCDGQGIAHPRGFGLACHMGLLVEKPTIGCAKSRLLGEFSEVGEGKGCYSELWHEKRVIGAVARTRSGVKPLFVSPGHRVTLEESLRVVFTCCKKYRVPEPIRLAHALVNGAREREDL
ncbi:MAG: deoxyribonuclease V [Deltaproteobacteria bacterium]